MTTVDGGFVEFESSAETRGRTLVDEVVRWEDMARLPVEEVEGLSVRVVDVKEGEIGAVGADSEGSCPLVLVALLAFVLVVVVGVGVGVGGSGSGLMRLEKKDSIGFCAAVVVVARSWRFTLARSTGGVKMVFLF